MTSNDRSLYLNPARSGRNLAGFWPDSGRILAGIWPDSGRNLAGFWPECDSRVEASRFRGNLEEVKHAIFEYKKNLTPEKCARYIGHLEKVVPVVIAKNGAL